MVRARGESRPIASALQELMLSTREEPGCVGCSLSTEMSAHVSVFYVEEWASEADLQRQLRSHRFALLAELMERASQSPTVEFVLPHSIRGLDTRRKCAATTSRTSDEAT
jgi:quinol monooxygenase YgiN